MNDLLNTFVKRSITLTGVRTRPADAPAAEQKVLTALRKLEEEAKPTHGPAIARATNGTVSVQAVYTLLDRLVSRGLVERKDVEVALADITVKRVVYSIASSPPPSRNM